MKKALVTTLFALSLGSVAQFAAAQSQPASIGEDVIQYLEAAVEAPTLTADYPVVSVYCQTDVGADGLTRNVSCYEKDGFPALRNQVEEAMAGRQFVAASVDGEKVPVRMVFRVVFADYQGQPPIMLLPNLGHMQGDFGYQYTAPQERLDDGNWYELYRGDFRAEGQPFFSDEGEMTRVHAWINARGWVIAANTLETSSNHRLDGRRVEKALKDSSFIAGQVNGQPERMRYIAVLHYLN